MHKSTRPCNSLYRLQVFYDCILFSLSYDSNFLNSAIDVTGNRLYKSELLHPHLK